MDCEDDYILQGDRFRVVERMFGGKLDLLLKSMESEKSTDIWADMCQNHWHQQDWLSKFVLFYSVQIALEGAEEIMF